MPKIDIHTHILPPKLPRFCEKFGYPGFIELKMVSDQCAQMVFDDGRHFRDIEDNAWNPERRIEQMGKCGVTTQVLSTIPVLFSYWAKPKDGLVVSQLLNDHIAEVVAKYPRSFKGLGTVPLQDTGLATEELNRCVNELGLSGVEIATHVLGRNFDDKELLPFFREADRLGAAIFVHPWDMLGGDRVKKYWFPWLIGMPTESAIAIASIILGGVFDECPNLRIAFAHGGGSFSALIGRIEHGFSVRPDLVGGNLQKNPTEYLGRFYVDSIVHTAQMLDHCMKIFGKDKILLGSDYPFPLGEERPGTLITSSLTSPDRERLLYRNAEKWLGLSQ